MVVTLEWMARWFSRLNRQCFQGELPQPELSISHARKRLGQCVLRQGRRPGRIPDRTARVAIALTTYYDMEEREAVDVLLHEMIHYYIALRHLKDTGPHGKLFRQIAQGLNAKWGRHVSVKTNVEGWKLARPGARSYLVLAVETSRGEHFLSVVAPSRARQLEDWLRKSREVTHHQWYTSRDDYFGAFPRVRSPRGRRVSEETLRLATAACQPIEL